MRVPVSITFDNMGLAADVGRGLASGPDPDEPGLRVALPAILDLLERRSVAATFFVEGWNGVHHADTVTDLVDRGHEVALHGWVHEPWATLDESTERDLLRRAIDSLSGCGAAIHGFRAPGGDRTPATLRLLAEAGVRYDSSLDPDGFRVDQTGTVVLPFEWPHVDWHWFGAQDPPAPPAAFREALDVGLERAARRGEPLVVIAHARTSGLVPERFEVLEDLLARLASDSRFELLPMRDLATRLAAA